MSIESLSFNRRSLLANSAAAGTLSLFLLATPSYAQVGSAANVQVSGTVAPNILTDVSSKLEIKEIGNLPLYNQDSDENTPTPWVSFRQQIKAAGAVLFATPEYNRSVSGALKNAIDVTSRAYGQNAWDGKPGAVISVSPGAPGGFGANHHLRQSLVFLNVPVLQQPEAYISKAAESLHEGRLIDDKARSFFPNYIKAFGAWINQCQPTKLQS